MGVTWQDSDDDDANAPWNQPDPMDVGWPIWEAGPEYYMWLDEQQAEEELDDALDDEED